MCTFRTSYLKIIELRKSEISELQFILENSQIQIFNQCQDFILVFLADERLDFLERDVSLLRFKGFRLQFPSYEPVRYMVFQIFCSRITLEQIADGDFQIREFLDFLAPGTVTINVRKIDHITAIQDFQSLIELALSSGGQPNVIRHQGRAYDRSLFGLHHLSHSFIRVLFQQMFAKNTLWQFPFLRQSIGILHKTVNPIYLVFCSRILYSLAGFGKAT